MVNADSDMERRERVAAGWFGAAENSEGAAAATAQGLIDFTDAADSDEAAAEYESAADSDEADADDTEGAVNPDRAVGSDEVVLADGDAADPKSSEGSEGSEGSESSEGSGGSENSENSEDSERHETPELTEVEKLFYVYRDSREVAVRNEIVGRYMYLIDIITRKFVNRGVEYEDLYQIASIALIKAVERFDLEKGVKFVSFATPTIVGEIKRYFRDKGSTIRIPRRIYEIYQKVNQAKEYLSQALGRTPMVSDIAEYLKISEENVLEIIESWNVYNIQSFEQNAFSEDNLELHETIGEDDFEFEKIENRDFIEKSMAKFSDSEREFISLRYMNDMTQKQIAAVMNVSQMYISRLEKKIIKKFRLILEK
ncbi:MAG: SigB/SigF/SigG family RNA polymerase sigma factor [Clostridiales bacterium]|jgi:RNA polymerase sigma-B factor|nr:SigB/SigF/SigG family RNA polymerase sigma factor [Clostridiales bacterium]